MSTASGWHYRSGLVNAFTHVMSTWTSTDFIASVAGLDRDVELDRTAIVAITNLGMHGPQRPSALAEALATGASNVSKIIARLEKQGLIMRATDPNDARASLIVLTDSGNDVAASLSRAGDSLADELLRDWSATDRAEFERLLSAFDEASTAYARRARFATGMPHGSPTRNAKA